MSRINFSRRAQPVDLDPYKEKKIKIKYVCLETICSKCEMICWQLPIIKLLFLLGSNCLKIEPCHIAIVCKFLASEGE